MLSTKNINISFTARSVFLLCFCLLQASSANAAFTLEQPTLLPSEEAFMPSVSIGGNAIVVNWQIAEGYYMYHDSYRVETNNQNIVLGELIIPPGKIEDDPEFGRVEVYFDQVNLNQPIIQSDAGTVELILHGQGCNKPVGVCYNPISQSVTLDINSIAATTPAVLSNAMLSSGAVTSRDSGNKYFGYLMAALGAGVLLSFTPCVLPMVPILAGIIAGQGQTTKTRSGILALFYVLGTIVTYSAAGAFAGYTGSQFQAYFQNPWAIGFICSILLLLAISLFGGFRIQLPSSIQTRLNSTQVNSKSAFAGSFALGSISALVVGACVSPILILTLGVAITAGDPVLGAAIMAMMALGMGFVLILFGFGAGWLLPKAGQWMLYIQTLFGFMLLAVVIYLLGAIPQINTLLLYGGWLLFVGLYLFNNSQRITESLPKSFIQALSIGMIVWSIFALYGGALGGTDLTHPLAAIQNNMNDRTNVTEEIDVKVVDTLGDVEYWIASANKANRPVLIDFYADWCLECRRMDKTTFRDAAIVSALNDWVVIKVDLTQSSDATNEIKKNFNIFGPPALTFYAANGTELSDYRNYGFLSTDELGNIIDITTASKSI